ncbi:MAG TPA: asparagine synthase (glutamine-hydrolyzing) [Gemmatimonadaceae bacterium]|nr:asparagine synthase (glutamine-hydrolyzing) [Gemmatimonadaceae bacterium]
MITAMCGFVGGVLKRPVTEADASAFRRAIRTLAHRGPDAEKCTVVSEANAVLAFRRLAIIDLDGGDQPMTTGSGQHLVFNGEIYNYKDVRRRLAARGAGFTGASDTEVLLRTLTLDGADGLDALKGMFAFGFLDVARRQLMVARDRLGVKQLYYVNARAGFFFASEPKALLALPWIEAELDPDRLASYFTFRCVPAPNTLLRGVSRLGAGCTLTYDIDTGQAATRRYWHLPARAAADAHAWDNGGSKASALDRFEEAFLESVRRRLVADVPVGAFLSGGLDSALVVAAMRRLGHANIQTFTATFPGFPDDESSYAQRVSRRFKTDHYECAVSPDGFIAALPRWIDLNDDLVADASSLPLMLVSDMARRAGCLVMLSGEGADELFSGYGAYHKFVALRRLASLVPRRSRRTWLLDRCVALGLVRAQDVPRVSEYFLHRGSFMGTAALFGTDHLRDLLTPDAYRHAESLPSATGTTLSDLCHFDLGLRIPDDLLVRTDRATMGASVEARVPFLDHDLVTRVLGMPSASRAIPGLGKVVPRLLARRWGVPLRTIVHRKIGFHIPLGDWFRGPMKEMWATILKDRAVPGLQYDEVERLHRAHARGDGHFEESLWRIAALETWYRRWVSRDAMRAAATAPMRVVSVRRLVPS